jgi:myo-inositol 2-dehydrogenase / D-chiro-inositol 1-dehydrogenase
VKSITSGVRNIGASAWDGYCSTATAAAGVEALHSGKAAMVNQIAKPAFYK